MRFLLLVPVALLLATSGCCRSAGSGVGKGVTSFTSGVGSGVDEELLVNLRFSDEAAKVGLAQTTAKKSGKRINVYVTAKSAFEGKLIAKALNKEGAEIGRSIVPITFTADDAKYVQFTFPNEMDSQLVNQYWVDVLK